MATLMLDRADLELRICDGALALYENDRRRQTVPIPLIERLIIQGSRTRLDSAVLLKLAEGGTSTLLLSARYSRRVAIVLGPAHNDAAIRLAQALRSQDAGFCRHWAQQLVVAKLRRQLGLLEAAMSTRPEVRKPLFDACESLRGSLARLLADEQDCERLRGFEGSAARVYFQGLGSLFAPSLGFTGRNRRPPRDPVNACLSLAYTLLHFEAVRAAHIAGLDPLIGFYHRPAFGRESLACDLIEPLRPHIDGWIVEQFRSEALRADHFSLSANGCLLGKAGRSHFYASWESFAVLPRRWLRQRCRILARQLRNEALPLLADAEEEDF
jgi:CRISPR-associated protein Cas1